VHRVAGKNGKKIKRKMVRARRPYEKRRAIPCGHHKGRCVQCGKCRACTGEAGCSCAGKRTTPERAARPHKSLKEDSESDSSEPKQALRDPEENEFLSEEPSLNGPLLEEKITEALRMLLANSGKEEKRLGRALLMHICSKSVREAHRLALRCANRSISFSTLEQSKADVDALCALCPLPRPVSKRRHYDVDLAREMVDFILSDKCVRIVSWSDRKVIVGGVAHVVPGLIRISTINELWRRYCVEVDRDGAGSLGRTTFQSAVKALTVHNPGSAQSLSYVYTEHVPGSHL